MSDEHLIQHVSDTALWVAHYRGVESDRPDAIFKDPLAKKLAGEKGRLIAESMPARISAGTQFSLSVRTHTIDAFIHQAIAEGVDTVVNLGAGLDTRPYRMELPAEFRWVEADFPHVIDYKEQVLASEKPVCRLERFRLDLSDARARGEFLAGINAQARKVLVLTEGVVPYLSNEDASALARDLRAQDRFAFWIVDYFGPFFYRFWQKNMKHHLKHAPFRFRVEDWHGFYRERGWSPREIRYSVIEGYKLKRLPPSPWWQKIAFRLMPRRKREQITTMSGYALMERVG